MDILLLVIGALAMVLGFAASNSTTFGVWFVGLALFCGIVARIVQAARHHAALVTPRHPQV